MQERLKKIYALAMQGVGGEKEAAAELLEKLTKKYGVSIEELDEEKISSFEMEFHGDIEKRLLVQVVYKVTGKSGNVYKMRYTESGRLCKTKSSVRCTEAQKIEIEFLFDFYKRLFEKEKEYLLKAFIQKHRIFGVCDNDEAQDEISREELLKIMNMAAGLSDETPLKQIEAPKK